MKVLALDTSTEACSIALAEGSELLEAHSVPGRGHAGRVLTDIESLLEQAGWKPRDLDLVACGCGPGSFTGVRIGVAAAQAIAFGADAPALGISTLQILAQGIDAARVVAALDARMGQVYVGAFERDADELMQPVDAIEVCDPATVNLSGDRQDWVGAGHGFRTYEDVLSSQVTRALPDALPRARDLMAIAHTMRDEAKDPVFLAPQYVRNDVAKVKGQA